MLNPLEFLPGPIKRIAWLQHRGMAYMGYMNTMNSMGEFLKDPKWFTTADAALADYANALSNASMREAVHMRVPELHQHVMEFVEHKAAYEREHMFSLHGTQQSSGSTQGVTVVLPADSASHFMFLLLHDPKYETYLRSIKPKTLLDVAMCLEYILWVEDTVFGKLLAIENVDAFKDSWGAIASLFEIHDSPEQNQVEPLKNKINVLINNKQYDTDATHLVPSWHCVMWLSTNAMHDLSPNQSKPKENPSIFGWEHITEACVLKQHITTYKTASFHSQAISRRVRVHESLFLSQALYVLIGLLSKELNDTIANHRWPSSSETHDEWLIKTYDDMSARLSHVTGYTRSINFETVSASVQNVQARYVTSVIRKAQAYPVRDTVDAWMASRVEEAVRFARMQMDSRRRTNSKFINALSKNTSEIASELTSELTKRYFSLQSIAPTLSCLAGSVAAESLMLRLVLARVPPIAAVALRPILLAFFPVIFSGARRAYGGLFASVSHGTESRRSSSVHGSSVSKRFEMLSDEDVDSTLQPSNRRHITNMENGMPPAAQLLRQPNSLGE